MDWGEAGGQECGCLTSVGTALRPRDDRDLEAANASRYHRNFVYVVVFDTISCSCRRQPSRSTRRFRRNILRDSAQWIGEIKVPRPIYRSSISAYQRLVCLITVSASLASLFSPHPCGSHAGLYVIPCCCPLIAAAPCNHAPTSFSCCSAPAAPHLSSRRQRRRSQPSR